MKEIAIIVQDGKVVDVIGLPNNYGFAPIYFYGVEKKMKQS